MHVSKSQIGTTIWKISIYHVRRKTGHRYVTLTRDLCTYKNWWYILTIKDQLADHTLVINELSLDLGKNDWNIIDLCRTDLRELFHWFWTPSRRYIYSLSLWPLFLWPVFPWPLSLWPLCLWPLYPCHLYPWDPSLWSWTGLWEIQVMQWFI